MKTRKFINIVAILVFLSIIVIFTACEEEEGTLLVVKNNKRSYNYYVCVYFDGVEVYSSQDSLSYGSSVEIPSTNKDVTWTVHYSTSFPITHYSTKVGLLQKGETITCNIP